MIYIKNFPTWFLSYFIGPIIFCAIISASITHWTFEQTYPLIQTMQLAPFLSYITLPLMKYVKKESYKYMLWWPYIDYA